MNHSRLWGIIPPSLACLLFVMSLHTARVPDGSLLPVFSIRTLLLLVAGLAGLGLIGFISRLLIRTKPSVEDNPFVLLTQPLYLLSLYPLAVFVFHPLGVPLPFSTLLQPDIILLLTGALFALRLALLTIPHTKVFQRLGSLLNARNNMHLAVLLFFGFLALYGILIKKEDRIQMLVGDEPHYMIMMESLRTYHTADLTKILESSDPLPNGVRKLRPHTSGMTAPGTLHEVHNIGISLMMIPGFSLVGYKGAIGTFGFLAALLVANMFLLGVETTGRKWISFIVASLAGLSAPFIFYFRYIYPEMPAALCLIYAVRVLLRERPSSGSLLLAGAGAAFMPWFHVKFVIMAAILAIFCAWKHFRSIKSILWYAVPHIPSAIILMCFFYHAYGSWMPNAQYGDAHDPVSKFFFRGAPGLLLDRDHGLLAFAPLYWLALPGLFLLFRQNRRYTFLALALTVPSFAILASHWMWWGGPCPPARFIIPLIPLFIPAVVCALAGAATPTFRLLAGGSIILTLALSAISLGELNSLPFHRHFMRWWVLSYDAFPFFPLFFIHRVDGVPRENFIVAAFWILAWCGSILMLRRSSEAGRISLLTSLVQAPTHAILTAGLLVLLTPGVIGYVNARMSGITMDHPSGATRELAHVNVVLDQYARPFERSGVSTEMARGRIDPYILYSGQKLEAGRSYSQNELDSETRERSWIFFGKYTTLYPVDYLFTFTGNVSSGSDGDLVLFDICNDLGRNILWVNKMPASAVNNDQLSFSVPFRPDGIKENAEFRAAALAPGSYRFEQVGIKASLP